MSKKLEFKDKIQRKKCWFLAILFTVMSMLIFFFTWLFCEVKLDFPSISIIFLIVFWQFYVINKFFITSESSNKTKIKSTVCSLLFLLLLSSIIVILGQISYPHFFDAPAKITILVVIPFIYLVPATKLFINYFSMSLTEKRLTFLYRFYAAVFSTISGFFLNFVFTVLKFTIIPSLFIGVLCILLFLSMVHTFDKFTLFNKKEQVKHLGINLLILLISIGLGGIIYLWIINRF